jgi:selenocysteine lyase/cysteine desulfurase
MADEGAGALATFHFAGRNARALAADLLDRERILVRAIVHPEFNGIRVAPNLFNSAAEIDRFALALRRVLRG